MAGKVTARQAETGMRAWLDAYQTMVDRLDANPDEQTPETMQTMAEMRRMHDAFTRALGAMQRSRSKRRRW